MAGKSSALHGTAARLHELGERFCLIVSCDGSVNFQARPLLMESDHLR